ncbi:MAG: DUF2281 domain-containing protein [Anaerolineae bacterium]|nr:DUF2281 domain-containing protein [Anaerolineae bacterium]
MNARTVERLLEVVEKLPEDKASEVLDFAQFLLVRSRQADEDKLPIEIWAEELARVHGFDHLTEDDVARIVKEVRREKS